MKKNYLFGLLSLFTLLFAASCQEEELAGGQMGDTATVTFQVNTPMLATRAVGDGETAKKLYVGIYEYGGNKADGALVGPLPASHLGIDGFASTIPFEAKKATVTLQLAKDKKYSVIFWAETEKNSDAIFNMDWDNRKLTLKDNLKANQESYDAFWKQIDVTLTGAFSETVELTRPFAQLNIGTSDKAAAEKVGLVVSQSQVVVNGVYNTFDLQTGNATGEANVTYTMESIAAIKDQTFPAITDPKQEYIALNYLLMANDPSTVDVAFSYTDADDVDPYNLNFTSVPLRRNYRTNIYGTLLTNSANYTVEIKPGFGNDGEEDAGNIVYVTTQEDFEKALKRNDENIVINLMPTQQKAATRAAGNANEFKIYVGAWTEKYYFGGVDTESITINANGCTINFVHENGDWNYIRCVNDDAKWIINDAHLTNSGKNEGPWNRHDIRFYNAVELNNVTSDKAIAVLNDGKLTNVTISEEGDVYGLWITAEGQKVELYNCTFKTAGRGIAIKDEYIDNPALVDLTVKNTKFNTEKKAAILVTSTAGADITLENVDLSGVKADGFNAVWVDEDRAEYADKVTVTGGFCVVEDATPTAENNPFLKEGATVEIPAGTYMFPAEVAKGVTINCAEGVVFEGQSNLNINGATVIGGTFSNEAGSAVRNTINGTFKECTFTGSNALRYCYAGETTVFEDCVFDGAVYGVHFDGGAYDVTFRRCTFSGFNAFGSALTQLTFEDCVFKSTGKSGYNGANLWGKTDIIRTKFIFDGAASTEWIGLNAAANGKAITLTDCVLEGTEKSMFEYFANYNSGNKVTIDGVEYVLVKDAEGLTAALGDDCDVKHIYLAEGTTIEGTFKPRGDKVVFSAPTNKATIKGRVNIDNYADGISFKNIKFDINDASKVKNSFTGSQYKYPGIVVIYASAVSFEGCEFKADMSSAVCGINYGAHAKGKMLTVNNCSFEGDFYAIRSRTLFSVTDSKFNIHTDQGKLCAVWTWGNGNEWENSVTFTGNENLNENEIYSVQLSSTNFKYNNIAIDVKNNKGFAKLDQGLNTDCKYSDITFAEGSESFTY